MNLALRLWNLNSPAALVFDEVHYVPFAVDYLQQQPFFDVHPPLGKYLIAFGIDLYQVLGLPDQGLLVNGMALNPISYRWPNALLGSFIPVVALWMAWTWTVGMPLRRRRCFAALAGLLTSWDGFTLVESRLGLLHPVMILLGLLALGAWGQSRDARYPWRWRLLTGIALGGAIAVKWNGAGYLLALALSEWFSTPPAPLIKGGGDRRGDQATLDFSKGQVSSKRALPWLWLLGIPFGVYSLLWIPHLHLVGVGFWEMHRTILEAHLGLAATHSYQSAWFTWPLMIRPIAYFYQGLGPGDALGLIGPPLPNPNRAVALYGMGNPILWWLSTAAVVVGALQVVTGWWPRRRSPQTILAALRQGQPLVSVTHTTSAEQTVQRFLLMAYGANWLPWVVVQRSTFLYHYQPAALMAELFLAWQISRWLTSRRRSWRFWGWGLLVLVFISFCFWLPLWIGWPLPLQTLGWRWWLPSWI
jgi:dolichyl-phosphate-mannose--protein O-mannosyl transferase